MILLPPFQLHSIIKWKSEKSFVSLLLNNITFAGGPEKDITSISGRMIHFTILLSTLLISFHYTSWLYSTLAVNIITYPFDGFQSILADGTYDVGVIKGYSIETDLKVIINIANTSQVYKYCLKET